MGIEAPSDSQMPDWVCGTSYDQLPACSIAGIRTPCCGLPRSLTPHISHHRTFIHVCKSMIILLYAHIYIHMYIDAYIYISIHMYTYPYTYRHRYSLSLYTYIYIYGTPPPPVTYLSWWFQAHFARAQVKKCQTSTSFVLPGTAR